MEADSQTAPQAARPVVTLAVLQAVIDDLEPGVVLDAFEMEAGCGRGDNYTAMLYRVALRGERGLDHADDAVPEQASSATSTPRVAWQGSLICKVLPYSARRREAFKSDALFRNEVAFYTRALPALLAFEAEAQGGAQMGERSQFAALPRCFRAKDDLVVLEDLRLRGFTMVDRRKGLDERHLRVILSRVAHFHALSLAMKALRPDTFAREVSGTVRETQFVADNEAWYRDYYRIANRHAVSMVHDGMPAGPERDRCVAAASAFLLDADDHDHDANVVGGERSPGTFFQRMVALAQPVEPLAVLCHGDCWTNNFLFRYDADGEIEEVMLVDYQMSRYGSPCLDLMLLLYSCTERTLRDALLEPLLRHYHAAVLDTLRRLGCGPPSDGPDYAHPERLWALLMADMHRLGRFGLGQAVDYIPCLCCDSEEAPNVYDSQGGPDGEGEDAEGATVEGPPAPVTAGGSRSVQRFAELVQELVAKEDL